MQRLCGWLLLLTLFASSACTRARIVLPPPAPDADVITVFVPGYRGSFLIEKQSGDTAWLTPGAAFSKGDRTLALPFEGQDPRTYDGPLIPDGVLTGFVVFPWIIDVDIYESFLRFGREALPGFVAFDYDWRQDLRDSGEKLCTRLSTLVRERGGNVELNLVAHSMGGLVTLECLKYASAPDAPAALIAAARAIRRIAFLGTPFHGAPGIFDDLLLGTSVVRNRHLLSASALFTFPAAFQLLPPTDDFLVRDSPTDAALHPFLPETWVKQRWGVFSSAELNGNSAYRAQLERQLSAHRSLYENPLLQRPTGLETLAVVGTGRATPSGFRVRDGSVLLEEPLTDDGDGTVLTLSATPPEVLKSAVFRGNFEHTEMLRDDAVREALIRFLQKTPTEAPSRD